MRFHLTASLVCLTAVVSLGQNATIPQITGYVTNTSANDLAVNGTHIEVGPRTTIVLAQPGKNDVETTAASLEAAAPFLGELADVFGEANRKSHAVAATRIVFHIRAPREVSGAGITDAILPLPAGASPASDRLIRADGYPVLIAATTKCTFDKPLAAPSDIAVNVWVTFHGTQRLDGVVLADTATFRKNIVKNNEDHLREKTDYDPAAVPDGTKQSGVSKAFRGIDPKQIPPTKDTAMQARVSAIGQKLIPKYQAGFPATEETRIDFRFQVIDTTNDTARWHDAITLPNGIILVPHHVVERMQNDSQLATVLADNIACALEKQPLAGHVLGEKLTAAQAAADVGGFFIPGFGIASALGEYSEANHFKNVEEDQSGRVSLGLLHDAGYDITQAPIAWWLLAPKKPEDLAAIPLPRRAANLYEFLGETWPSP